MSRAESANARNATAAPAPSSSRGSDFPSHGPAPPVGAYQAYLDSKRRDQEQEKLMEIDRMYERRPIHLEWEEHAANVDAIRQAFEAERASTAQQRPPPRPKAGRIASMLPQKQPYGDANAASLESIPGSTRVTVSRPSQQDVIADNRRRWLSKLRPPVIHKESTSNTALDLLPKPLLEMYLYLTQDGPAERTSFLPECIRETVTAEIGQGPLPSSFFFTDPSISGQTIKRIDQVRDSKEELDTLKKLIAQAAQCGTQDRDWTTKVRAPLIAHAIGSGHKATLQCCVLGLRAGTSMHPDCIPVPMQLLQEDMGFIEGRVSMTINIKDSCCLSRAIEKKQPVPGAPVHFVNHIYGDIYGSISGDTSEGGVLGQVDGNGHTAACNYPIACLIESQARPIDGGAMHRWGVDLGIHAAALHNRLSWFLNAKYGTNRKENYRSGGSSLGPDDGIPEPMYRPLIPALPLIFVAGHDWYLYFACDGDTEIVLLSGLPMGSTRNLVSIYQLVKVLRDIGRYLENHYKPWLVTLFDCQWPHDPWRRETTNRPLHAGR
ncbi:hypothetical protein BBO_07587 [Beauveria brongniartii RCEF 3172]|uniref:PD-(D/E)XK nuclease-like domain-containing protein n=1 Tax=Beauveria brongniartii RCEF 3172 TaxID=1081107 RepID=A0A166Z4Q9_9HYPO|nr:hypothetical protein BBO_07587 [Beauveria brongniartii RCEF 3172]